MTESLYHRDDKPGAVTPLFVLRQQVAEMFRSGGDYGIRESAAQVYPDHYDVGGGDLGVVLHEGLALSVWGSSSYGAPLRTPRPGTPVRESAQRGSGYINPLENRPQTAVRTRQTAAQASANLKAASEGVAAAIWGRDAGKER